MLRNTWSAVAIVATIATASASADPVTTISATSPSFEVSAFALPVADLAQGLTPETDAVGFAKAPPGTTLESSRYRPRPRRYPPRDRYDEPRRSRSSNYGAPFQIHAGFFEINDDQAPTSFLLGLRGGPNVDPHIQLAFGIDWMHNGEKSRTVSGEPYEQGGVIIVPERELSRASSDLLPMTANLQVNLSTDGPIVPYVGIGGGWQVLFLNAEDFSTGEDFDATFSGWSWQLYGGVQLPLSGQSRLLGEVFMHQGEAEREVDDVSGVTYREIVDLDGMGMRFGLSWGF